MNHPETLYELRMLADSECLPSWLPICDDKTSLTLFIIWCSRLRVKLTSYLHQEQIKNTWNSTSTSQVRRNATFLTHGGDSSCVIRNQKLKYVSWWYCCSFVADANRSIQDVSWGKVNILEGHGIGLSKQKKKCICTCVLFRAVSEIELFHCTILYTRATRHVLIRVAKCISKIYYIR
jgi:hypothetical protein